MGLTHCKIWKPADSKLGSGLSVYKQGLQASSKRALYHAEHGWKVSLGR